MADTTEYADTHRQAALVADGLVVRINERDTMRTVGRRISLTLDKGQVAPLGGETGCGKTLTALFLIGLLPPVAKLESGQITLQGENLDTRGERGWRRIRRRRVAMIPQDPLAELNPVCTIGFQLCEPLTRILKLPKTKAVEQARSLGGQVGIDNLPRCSSDIRTSSAEGCASALVPGVRSGDTPRRRTNGRR